MKIISKEKHCQSCKYANFDHKEFPCKYCKYIFTGKRDMYESTTKARKCETCDHAKVSRKQIPCKNCIYILAGKWDMYVPEYTNDKMIIEDAIRQSTEDDS